MDIYFYCNYINSRKGFFLTKLSDSGLIPATFMYSNDKYDMFLDRFFSYDCFRVLWYKIPKNESASFFPKSNASFFGLRNFTGDISDRKGYLNLAFLAKDDEIATLDKLADGILADINSFVAAVFSCLSVGSKNSYELDTQRFMAVIGQAMAKENSQFYVLKKSSLFTAKDLLRFGVCKGGWDYASKLLCDSISGKSRPKQMLDESEFERMTFNS
ncbi:MAG: hypothetical protein IKK37_02700 [Clostridia bacterium]|nr:hypothetical protein [Clostridia bacterium]